MGLGDLIRGWMYQLVLKKASKHRTFDIIEVRTKELTLTYVAMETDVRIENSFFLPITILSIETDIVNSAGTRVGKMQYKHPKRLKGHSSEVFTTHSTMSNITAFFNALQHLLAMSVTLRSVGTARIKFLWWTFDIPVDDTFEVKSSQVRLTEELSEEEKQKRDERKRQEREEREQRRVERRQRVEKRFEKKTEKIREKMEEEEIKNSETEPVEEDTMEIELNEEAERDISSETLPEMPSKNETDPLQQDTTLPTE